MYRVIVTFVLIGALGIGFYKLFMEPTVNGPEQVEKLKLPTATLKITCDDAPEDAILTEDLPPELSFIKVGCLNIGHAISPSKESYLWFLAMKHIQDIVYPDFWLGLAKPLNGDEVYRADYTPPGHGAYFTAVEFNEFTAQELETFVADLPESFTKISYLPSIEELDKGLHVTFTSNEDLKLQLFYVFMKEPVFEKVAGRKFDAFGRVCWPDCGKIALVMRHLAMEELSNPRLLRPENREKLESATNAMFEKAMKEQRRPAQ